MVEAEELDFENIIRVNYLTQGVIGLGLVLVAIYNHYELRIKDLINKKRMISRD